MCGRIFYLFESTEKLLEAINFELKTDIVTELKSADIYPRYNVAPTTNIPIISDSNSLILLPWGFKAGPIQIINARNEDIESKKSFKHLIDTNRCVIVCSGYYEWDQKNPKNKKPYSFRPKGHDICFIAGLRNPETNSVVLITREAVDSIAKIHTRMPVILRSCHLASWLNNNKITFENLKSSIIDEETYKDFIEFQAVNPIVSNARNESPLCLQSYAEYRKEGQNSFFTNRTKKVKLDVE